jgi:uncharacterized protein
MLGAAVTLLAALAAAAPAPATTPPPPARWVTDHAGLLSPQTRQALDVRLESYERATGHQVVVWIDRTLSGAPLDDWAVRTFEAWKPGRKGQDDGIAMFIFSEDRKIDIEVGYGLEDEVPDAIASRIIREVMAPRLQAGDRDGAVTAGVDAVLAAIEGRPWTSAPATTTEAEPPAWVTWGGGALLAILALILFIKYPRAAMWLFWILLASRGRGGGGGIGGGGFGGGGGRSGGGGARGGW